MKTIFKIFAIIFLINLMNMICSFWIGMYIACGVFKNNNNFLIDLFGISFILIIPLSFILILLLEKYDTKPVKIWKWNLK